MDIGDIFNKCNRGKRGSIPSPNADVKMSGSKTNWTEEEIRGIICNPIYAGIGPFPAFVSDEEWVKCASILISNEGAEQFLVNLLHTLRTCLPSE